MLKRFILISLIIITYLLICNNIYIKNYPKRSISTSIIKNSPPTRKDIIGKLVIEKISINQPLYNINSKNNNIEENITILSQSIEPTEENSIMYIAAHSGTGKIAYFNELDKLTINDKVKLIYKNKVYWYIINKIWEEKKDGYIHIKKENTHQLILTTCSPTKNDKQLVISSILENKKTS